jgi:hypothetical protein
MGGKDKRGMVDPTGHRHNGKGTSKMVACMITEQFTSFFKKKKHYLKIARSYDSVDHKENSSGAIYACRHSSKTIYTKLYSLSIKAGGNLFV